MCRRGGHAGAGAVDCRGSDEKASCTGERWRRDLLSPLDSAKRTEATTPFFYKSSNDLCYHDWTNSTSQGCLSTCSVTQNECRASKNRECPASSNEVLLPLSMSFLLPRGNKRTHQKTPQVTPGPRLGCEIVGSVQHSHGHPAIHEAVQSDLIHSNPGFREQTCKDCSNEQWHVLHVVAIWK